VLKDNPTEIPIQRRALQARPQAGAILKSYLVVRLIRRVYFMGKRPPPLFVPSDGGQMTAERTAHATPFAPKRQAALSSSL
jgi:hypothetical protein